jgi:EmrB/QacA subfamily drug resistance transporter
MTSSSSPKQTRKGPTVLGLILAFAMAALEGTVVSTVMPTVVGDLGGLEYYSWVTTAYLVASAVTVPLYGKLADIYGRKPILLAGIALFLLGSAASGAAHSMPALIAFRALQGLGAGSMQPIAITVVGDIFDLEQRSKIQGLFGASWGFFGLVGPVLGGAIVANASWRWVFYMNVPFGVASALLVLANLHERIEKRPREIDWAGSGLLAAGVGALLLASTRPAPLIFWAAAASAVALLAMFVVVERRAKEPVLPFELFTRPVMAVSSPAGAIIGGSMMGILTYVPLYAQAVLHTTPFEAGSAMAAMMVGWPIASTISGRLIPRLGFRPLTFGGLFVTAVMALALALFGPHASLWGLRGMTFGFGVGMGFANTALVIAVQTSVPWRERGVATASTMFFRTIGGALAVGVMGGVINAALAKDPTIPPGASSQILSREGLKHIDPALLERLSGVLDGALGTVFWIVAGMGVTAFVVSLWFPKGVVEAEHGVAADVAVPGKGGAAAGGEKAAGAASPEAGAAISPEM